MLFKTQEEKDAAIEAKKVEIGEAQEKLTEELSEIESADVAPAEEEKKDEEVL